VGRSETNRPRRDVLGWLGASAIIALLGRCASGPSREEIEAQVATYDAVLECTDTSGLWPAERKTREDNRYRDRSDRALDFAYCFRCDNFQPPVDRRACGSCRTVKGPIHPLGGCTAWILRRA